MGIFISRENFDRLGVAPAQTTLSLPTAGVEASYTIPDKCKRLIFGLRSGSYSFKYGFATGAEEFTVPAGAFRDISDVYLVSQVLWVKCDEASGQTLEIEYWL